MSDREGMAGEPAMMESKKRSAQLVAGIEPSGKLARVNGNSSAGLEPIGCVQADAVIVEVDSKRIDAKGGVPEVTRQDIASAHLIGVSLGSECATIPSQRPSPISQVTSICGDSCSTVNEKSSLVSDMSEGYTMVLDSTTSSVLTPVVKDCESAPIVPMNQCKVEGLSGRVTLPKLPISSDKTETSLPFTAKSSSLIAQPHSLPMESLKVGKVEDVGDTSAWTKIKSGNGRRVPAPSHPPEAELTDYERERAENIRRNELFLEKLGISMAKESIACPVGARGRPRGPKSKAPPATTMPLRRSMRGRPPAEVSSEQQAASDTPEQEVSKDGLKEEADEVSFDDSSVVKYKYGGTLGTNLCGGSPMDGLEIGRFHPMPEELVDPNLTRIYTMDLATMNGGNVGLLAAGGHKGRIAVFGTSAEWTLWARHNGEIEKFEAAHSSVTGSEGSFADTVQPLLTWKGSSGWISQVQFLSKQREDTTLLLSSSNDGSVVLWDLNKQQPPQISRGVRHNMHEGGRPRSVTETHSLHCNGIFSMHELELQIATGSKDCSVACSVVTQTAISRERVIEGHHTGAVRGVRFRERNILADCGADGRICILDLRLPSPCSLTIAGTHTTAINVVEWNPSQESLILSASNDPQLYVHDIRNPVTPLHKLVGHCKSQLRRCSHIYRPAFAGVGRVVATPGEGSNQISLYSMTTGKPISRGNVGYDANMVMGTNSLSGSRSELWAAGKHIVKYAPVWQPIANT